MFSPILIIVYDRYEHLKVCIESLKLCPEAKDTDIYIASDAALDARHESNIAKVRDYILDIEGFNRVTPIFRKENFGSKLNFFSAIEQVFKDHKTLIALEDDVVVGKGFLHFLNQGLTEFESDKSVISICAYLPPSVKNDDGEPFFLQGRAPYGYGMWKEKESWISNSCNKDHIRDAIKDFRFFQKFEETHPHVARAIPLIINGDLEPYDIMTAIIMQKNGYLALYPPQSISMSIGNDGSGLHATKNETLQDQSVSDIMYDTQSSKPATVNLAMERKLSKYYRSKFIGLLNYAIYFSYQLPGGYFFYNATRNLTKKIRRIVN